MTWAAVAVAGAAVVSGVISASAASDAADAQVEAADKASSTTLKMYDQTRSDLEPYRTAGTSALKKLQDLTDKPLTYDTYKAPAAYKALPAYSGPTDAELRADPGYQFRVSEGQKAIERSGASKGLSLSGGQLKDLDRFGQDLGSQEYSNVYKRGWQKNYDEYARGWQENEDIYTRGYKEYTTNYDVLTGLRKTNTGEQASIAAAGKDADTTLGSLGSKAAATISDNTIGAGNATAAGTVGTANAYNTAIGGVTTAASSTLSSLSKDKKKDDGSLSEL